MLSSPARLSRKIGPAAYRTCTRYRLAAWVFETLAMTCYVAYSFLPPPIPLPPAFPWARWVSVLIAAGIGLPCGYLLYRGARDAGKESLIVNQEHTLYGGIYETIRHPQTAGEVPLRWALAFFLHSPFLAIYSVVWIPIFIVVCWAEERDLVIRYGQTYEEYRRRTPALIPRWW